MNILCNACQSQEFKLIERTFVNGTKHIQAVCSHCAKAKQFIKQDEDEPVEALEKAPLILGFGKYKGTALAELVEKDRGYVKWLVLNVRDRHVVEQARAALEAREGA